MSQRSGRLIRLALGALAGIWIAITLAPGPTLAGEPAKVTVEIQREQDGRFRATAVVVDAAGGPAADVPVVLKARTTFGWLTLADATTDASGRARVLLPRAPRTGEIAAEAGDDGQVRATIRLGEARITEPAQRPGREALSALSPQPGLISPYPVPLQVALLGLILGGIWATYGYVAWLLSRIRSAR